MKIFDLTPNNGRKSFYGKAKIHETEEKAQLYSYNTLVAEIDWKKDEINVYNLQSTTTCNHVRAFFFLYGIKDHNLSKKELAKEYDVID